MAFCTACGGSLAPSAYGQAPAAAPVAAAAQPAPPGPRGVTQEPVLVVVLALVTLGIYTLFYWWRVSKETDAWASRAGHAHKPVQAGVLLGVAVGAVGIIAFVAMLGSIFASLASGAPEVQAMTGMATYVLAMMLVMVGGIASLIFLAIGQWRVWSAIEADERRRGHPSPLSPGLQLLFVLLPYVNIVTGFIALYRTQERLNEMWATR